MISSHSRVYIDTEVRQPAPQPKEWLNTYGLDRYARHPDTRLLLFSYAIGDGPVQVWDCYHQPEPPRDLRDALADPGFQIVAFNAMFDRVVLMHKGPFNLPIERWYCMRARAYAHGLPGGLDKLSRIYRLGENAKQKKRGDELIQLFCVQGADPDDYPVEWLEFCSYALSDITSMRALDHKMPEWCFDERELAVWHLDQHINDRGFSVDLDLTQRMIDASEHAQQRLNARVQQLTDGLIQKGTQREKLQTWLNDGTDILPDMRAETLRKTLRDADAGRVELSPEQREMIELRLLSAKSSIAKCKTALNTHVDGRIRYTITYGGGGRNLRFSHKGFQPGNMPRPSREREEPAQQLAIIEALKDGYATTIWGDETMAACADGLRGLLVAADGHKFLSVDWSNIEGRFLAWLASEEWKLQAYRDKDAGQGEDAYKLVFHRMTGTPIDEIDSFRRQQGKGADLSMGYEGGVGAYVNIAMSYQLDLVELGCKAPQQLPAELMERGEWDWQRAVEREDTQGLPREIYVACAANKHGWRDAHPRIVTLWHTLLECAKAAVEHPGRVFQCARGRIHMLADQNWLAIQVPSGRKIMFAKPRLKQLLDKNGKPTGRTELSALKAPQWVRHPLYGGLIANAVTQGGCRDILTDRMLATSAAGFPIVLHVHDDIISEVPVDSADLTLERQTAIMLDLPACYEGLPLSADGFETTRLYKG